MKKYSLIIMTIAAMSQVAIGGVICSGESDDVNIDLLPGVRTAAQTERICYSTGWVEGAGLDATAEIAVNGEILSSATGSGYINWTPLQKGTYTLTHKVMLGEGQVGETLTATFVVNGPSTPVFTPDICREWTIYACVYSCEWDGI